jgi:hypothetical protein
MILVPFENCGQQGAFRGPASADSQAPPRLPSVFETQKNQVAKDRFVGAEQKLDSQAQLVVMINNSCAKSLCSQASQPTAISCQVTAKGMHPRLVSSSQVYPVTPPHAMTFDELSGWISTDPIDQACLAGIGAPKQYKADGYLFNDPLYPTQKTYMDLTNFEMGQAILAPSALAAVKVGVVDTGVGESNDFNSSDVVSRESYTTATVKNGSQYPLFQNDDVTLPNNPHATFVAGIITALQNNSTLMVGVAPNVQIYSYGVGDSRGEMTTAEIANAIEAAVQDQVDVVNLSLGDAQGGFDDDPMVRQAVIDGYNSNIFFVAAAGNSSQDLDQNPCYPAQYSLTLQNVIAVAATDNNGSLASFSNYSPDVVNLAAPGTNITSILPNNLGGGSGQGSGTSFAAPMVTGAVALAIGYERKQGLTLQVTQTRALMTTQAMHVVQELQADVAGGAMLDFGQLAAAVQAGVAQPPLTVSEALGTDGNGNEELLVNISWNSSQVNGFPPGSNIGIFDGSPGCNFSAPCLITSYVWPPTGAKCSGNQCTLQVAIPWYQVASIGPNGSDPTSALWLQIAVYNQTMNGNGQPNTVFNVSTSSQLNLRNLNANLNLPLTGLVTNIRTDMRSLYVDGWACLPGSEAAVPVEILLPSGTPLQTNYSYNYPYMVPHGTPIDSGGDYTQWMTNVGKNLTYTGWPHSKPFLAVGMVAQQQGQTSYLSGLLSNPQLLPTCKTLTVAHGFEFVVSLDSLQTQQLNNTLFSVEVMGSGGTKVPLADGNGVSNFQFPDIASAVSDLAGLNRSSSCDKIWAKKGLGHGKKEIHT